MVFFPENSKDWKKIGFLIERSENIFITSHMNPDGDAIGSEIALTEFLLRKGKSVRIFNHSNTPEAYKFLDPEGIIESFPERSPDFESPNKSDLVFFLDFGKVDRAGNCSDFFGYSAASKIVIDHHPPESIDAEIIVINTGAASTGSLIYDLIRHIDASLINTKIALAIMTAVVTDTGYFRHNNTTATTHLIASSLFQYGVNASDLRSNLDNGFPVCRQKLLGLTLSNVRLSLCGKFAYAHITESMFNEAGANREHTDRIIDQIRIIKNIQIAALIIQDGKKSFKVSFRSAGAVSVNAIASLLGGGGHPRAAGASLKGSLEHVTAQVLEAVGSFFEQK